MLTDMRGMWACCHCHVPANMYLFVWTAMWDICPRFHETGAAASGHCPLRCVISLGIWWHHSIYRANWLIDHLCMWRHRVIVHTHTHYSIVIVCDALTMTFFRSVPVCVSVSYTHNVIWHASSATPASPHQHRSSLNPPIPFSHLSHRQPTTGNGFSTDWSQIEHATDYSIIGRYYEEQW